jgi:hypothetical protein
MDPMKAFTKHDACVEEGLDGGERKRRSVHVETEGDERSLRKKSRRRKRSSRQEDDCSDSQDSSNYIDDAATGGASTIPPARFGGNIDDYRIGKGGTMYYVVEVPGAQIVVGDTHAAQGDSELAGTAMETSMTTKLRITLHKADSLPTKVSTLDFPLLETLDSFVIHGFAYANYLDDLEDPSTIFAEGASIDLAMEDCFIRTRNWLMDVYDMLEEETIALSKLVELIAGGNWQTASQLLTLCFSSCFSLFSDYGDQLWHHSSRRWKLGCPCGDSQVGI